MAHTSEKRWRASVVGNTQLQGVSELATDICRDMVEVINQGEEAYQSMQEIYIYAGGTVGDLALLLFKEDIEAREESVANAEETAKASDLIDAMTAAHQLYQAANNVAVSQDDRFTKFRRMV